MRSLRAVIMFFVKYHEQPTNNPTTLIIKYDLIMYSTTRTLILYVLFFFGICCLSIKPANAALTASVDRVTITENDIIQLSIRSTNSTINNNQDFALQLSDFSILNSQQSNSLTCTNGQCSSIYDLVLTILPKHTGMLTIPIFSINGETTAPININVTATVTNSNNNIEPVFIKRSANKNSIYVQEQLILNIKIYHSVRLNKAQITELTITDAHIQKLVNDQESEEIINGVRYAVIEQNYAIFPATSGQLTIPEQLLTGRTSSRSNRTFRNNESLVRVKAKPINITVLPKPASFPINEPWLPAQNMIIHDSWQQVVQKIKAGEPATRTINITASGIMASQLPIIRFPQVSGLKTYSDQPQQQEQATKQGIIAKQISATAIVPTNNGEYNLPFINVYWWNTDTDKLMVSKINGALIKVSKASLLTTPIFTKPTTNNIEPEPAAINNQPHWLWQMLTIIFALLWLTTTTLWWLSKNRNNTAIIEHDKHINKAKLESHRQAYRKLCTACHSNEPIAARAALLTWLKLLFSDESIKTLENIKHLEYQQKLDPIIIELDSVIYGKQEDKQWSGKALLAVIEQIKTSQNHHIKKHTSQVIPALYPQHSLR